MADDDVLLRRIEHLGAELAKTQGERDHFYNQFQSAWAALTPRSEEEKRGYERVLAILKAKLADGGGIVGRSEVQRAHNDFYRGRRLAFEECATMLRAALSAPDHCGLLAAARQMLGDYQTSEHHHPNHVLVPLAAFKAMQDAITAKGSSE